MRNFSEDLTAVLAVTNTTGKEVNFPIKYNGEFENKPIAVLDIGARASNVLKRNKIFTIKDLFDVWDRVMSFKNCGAGTAKEIKMAFMKYYYDALDSQGVTRFWQDFIQQNGGSAYAC